MTTIRVDRSNLGKVQPDGVPYPCVMLEQDGCKQWTHRVTITGPASVVQDGSHVWVETESPCVVWQQEPALTFTI